MRVTGERKGKNKSRPRALAFLSFLSCRGSAEVEEVNDCTDSPQTSGDGA